MLPASVCTVLRIRSLADGDVSVLAHVGYISRPALSRDRDGAHLHLEFEGQRQMRETMRQWWLWLIVLAVLAPSLACGPGIGAGQLEFKVVNETPDDVCYVQISPQESDDWGEDKLGEDEVIPPGATRSLRVEPGIYDVLMRDCNGIPVESFAGLSTDTALTVGGEGKLGLLVENRSPAEICYLYVAEADADEWGQDRLSEAESIFGGESRIFYLPAGVYDLLAQDCQREDLAIEFGVDLTAGRETWTVADNR